MDVVVQMSASAKQVRRALEEQAINATPSCERVARNFGLSAVDLQTLHLLHLRPTIRTASRICAETGIPSSTVTRILDRLEAAEYIRRNKDSNDRRLRVIATVPERLAPLIEFYDTADRLLEAETLMLSENEIQTVATFLERLANIRPLQPQP